MFSAKIEQFFKDSLIEKDYILEPLEMNKYSLGFSFPDVAFDFNRYMNALKLVNDIFKDVKSQVIQNHKKIIKIIFVVKITTIYYY